MAIDSPAQDPYRGTHFRDLIPLAESDPRLAAALRIEAAQRRREHAKQRHDQKAASAAAWEGTEAEADLQSLDEAGAKQLITMLGQAITTRPDALDEVLSQAPVIRLLLQAIDDLARDRDALARAMQAVLQRLEKVERATRRQGVGA